MNVLMMWLGLALLIAGLCFAAASGAFAIPKGQNAPRNVGYALRLQRAAKLMVFLGILLWIFGALFTAGTAGR